ncbi:MAG: MarR family winged helix-turn-helix transcriptional regulator [Spirochaeta sp.]
MGKSLELSAEQMNEYERAARFGSLVSVIYRMSSAYIGGQLKDYHIGAGQHACLLVIAESPGVSQDELARILSMDKAHIARAVARLEAEGYITRKESSKDARKKSLAATPAGLALVPKIGAILQKWNESIFQGIPDSDIHKVNSVLRKIVDNIG